MTDIRPSERTAQLPLFDLPPMATPTERAAMHLRAANAALNQNATFPADVAFARKAIAAALRELGDA